MAYKKCPICNHYVGNRTIICPVCEHNFAYKSNLYKSIPIKKKKNSIFIQNLVFSLVFLFFYSVVEIIQTTGMNKFKTVNNSIEWILVDKLDLSISIYNLIELFGMFFLVTLILLGSSNDRKLNTISRIGYISLFIFEVVLGLLLIILGKSITSLYMVLVLLTFFWILWIKFRDKRRAFRRD